MKWIDLAPVEVPTALSAAVKGDPLVSQTLVRRGVLTAERARAFLDPDHYRPAPAEDLPDLGAAVERLRRAIRLHEKIAVWGDFDADGLTATALLVEALGSLGASVTFRIPRRDEGHGVHLGGVRDLVEEGVRLILTCDTGISAHVPLSQAMAAGVDVVITDHHVPSAKLPPAVAVVNPHRLPPGHPMSTLSGVGVAHRVAEALGHPAADAALDLVAVGLVADVSALIGDTRYLVQRGLQALRRTTRAGLHALYELADLRPEGITEEHVAFTLAPRLNAVGRLGDATHGVALLTTHDLVQAKALATEMEGLNARRQWLSKQVTNAALAQIDREPALLEGFAALVLSHPAWPSGIIGVVAGRLSKRFGRPAVLISAPPGEPARGSGRSSQGVDLVAALSQCKGLLQEFGGHPGAAGFSMQADRIPELRDSLSRAVAAQSAAAIEPSLPIDAYVQLSDLTIELAAQINRLAPFGPGNPPLTLAVHDLRILSAVNLGRTNEHRRVIVEGTAGQTQAVVWWNGMDWPLPQGRFDLALTVRAADYRGVPEAEVQWVDARERQVAPVEMLAAAAPELHDYRRVPNPEHVLHTHLDAGDIQVWAEETVPAGVTTRTRHELAPCGRLAIWTLPPGPDELQAALDRAQPQEIFLFGLVPRLGRPGAFLNRLARLVKYALETQEGWFDLEKAAAATAQRVSLVRAGLEWLAARGQLEATGENDGARQLARGSGRLDPRTAQEAHSRIEELLAETSAYRAYVLRTPISAVLRR